MKLQMYKFSKLLSKEQLRRIEESILQYPKKNKRAALIQIMHIVQESTRWISKENIIEISDFLDMPLSKAEEVASFYSMFYYNKPVGKFVISVCRTTPCWICSSDKTINYIKSLLNIDVNETTKDDLFTLNEVECLGRCSEAPVVKINNQIFVKVDKKRAEQIIKELIAKESNESDTDKAA